MTPLLMRHRDKVTEPYGPRRQQRDGTLRRRRALAGRSGHHCCGLRSSLIVTPVARQLYLSGAARNLWIIASVHLFAVHRDNRMTCNRRCVLSDVSLEHLRKA
jgi:hypothetical protein